MTQHLIHIGWAKAGSTFLQEWFARHPQLHYLANGIAGFQGVMDIARAPDAPYRYHVTSAEHLSSPSAGEAKLMDLAAGRAKPPEPVQEKQAAICETLRTLFPGSRILIITRGFRALHLSGYSQEVKAGGVLGVKARYEAMRGAATTQSRNTDGRVFRHRDFDYVIGLYREAFGRDNVIVLPYELLRDDQDRFLAVLEERLGLEHRDIPVGRLNPSLSAEELAWYPVISRCVSAAVSVLGRRAFRRIYPLYTRLIMRNRLAPLIRLLARLRPGRGVTDDDFVGRPWIFSHGLADSLRGDPLYAPYAVDYLWDEESALEARKRFTMPEN